MGHEDLKKCGVPIYGAGRLKKVRSTDASTDAERELGLGLGLGVRLSL